MKKIISLICLLTLVLTVAVPMQFASAAAPAVTGKIGDERITIGDATYVAKIVESGMAKPSRGTYDFQNDNGVPELDTGTFVYNGSDGEMIQKSYTVDLFSNMGLGEDTYDHKGVFRMNEKPAEGENWSAMYIFSNGTYEGVGIVAVLDFDIYYKGGFSKKETVLNIAVNTEGSTSDQFKLKVYNETAANSSANILTYNNKTAGELSIGQWHRVTFMFDVANDTITTLIDGVPYLVNEPMEDKIDAVRRAYLYRGTNDAVLLDNITSYVYLPNLNVSDVKGVEADGITLKNNLSYEKGSKLAVKFNTLMKAESFSNSIKVSLKDGNEVKINDISPGDYDASTNILYLTLAEGLKPNSIYSVSVMPVSYSATGEYKSGALTIGGIGNDAEIITEISTESPSYGVAYTASAPTLTAGSTTTVTIEMRTNEPAADSNLLLALYVDGKLRSLDSEVIAAGSAAASYDLDAVVPSGTGAYTLKALLIGTNFEIIDVIDIPLS